MNNYDCMFIADHMDNFKKSDDRMQVYPENINYKGKDILDLLHAL